MPKTIKGDGMERRAKKYLGGYEGTMTYALQVHKLTRLLRKVAREAARDRDKVLDKWYDDFYALHRQHPTVVEFISLKGVSA